MAELLPFSPFRKAPRGEAEGAGAGERRRIEAHVVPGRLVELAGGADCAATTAAVSILIHCQRLGEPTAWVQPVGGALFPPDLAAAGADLGAMAVVQVPRPAGPTGLVRAAELLLRSGGFGLVVLDLSERAPRGEAWVGRMAGLLRRHGTRLLILSPHDARGASLGTMVSLRIAAHRVHPAPGRFLLEPEIVKDKTGSSVAPAPSRHRGPWGIG